MSSDEGGHNLSRVGRRNEVGGRSGWTCCKMTKDDSSAAELLSSGHPPGESQMKIFFLYILFEFCTRMVMNLILKRQYQVCLLYTSDAADE